MPTPELSRRLGEAVGTHAVDPDEQKLIFDAYNQAEDFDDLPSEIQQLVQDIEASPPSP